MFIASLYYISFNIYIFFVLNTAEWKRACIVDHPTTEQNSRRFIKLSLHKLLSHRITLLGFFSNSAVVVFVIFTIGSTLVYIR